MLHKGVAAVVLMAAISFPTLADHELIEGFNSAMPIQCAEAAKIDHKLRTVHKEAPIARGYTSAAEAMQVYRSEDGHWSITIISPTGMECLVMFGEKYKDVPWVAVKPKESL